MKGWFFKVFSLKKDIFLIFLLLPVFLFSKELITLKGNPIQGALMLGEISSQVERIFLNYRVIPIFENRFIIGFNRDEPSRQIITVVKNDGEIFTISFHIQQREYKYQEITITDKKFKDPWNNPEISQRIQLENERLYQVRSNMDIFSKLESYRFIRPVTGGRISSEFGFRRIINGNPGAIHNGLDIALPAGTDVKAMSCGEVILADDFFYNGRFVLIDHGSGLSSIYLHLQDIYVCKGQKVKTGDIIGTIGSSGRSTGPHLHWEIRWRNCKIDPEKIKDIDDIFLQFSEE